MTALSESLRVSDADEVISLRAHAAIVLAKLGRIRELELENARLCEENAELKAALANRAG